MDFLEESLKELKQQNNLLVSQVNELKQKNELLIDANQELRKALAESSYTCSCLLNSGDGEKNVSKNSNVVVQPAFADNVHFLSRPEVSHKFPLKKGQWTILAQSLIDAASLKLWKIFLLYLLSRKCWKTSRDRNSLMTLKDWQQVCWKKLNSMDQGKTVSSFQMRFETNALC